MHKLLIMFVSNIHKQHLQATFASNTYRKHSEAKGKDNDRT